MMKIDKDLLSIQEVRNLIEKAKEAQKILATYTQQEIDKIVKAMAEEGMRASRWLAKVAVEETEIGIFEFFDYTFHQFPNIFFRYHFSTPFTSRKWWDLRLWVSVCHFS
jgi:hypothetical protein